MCGIYYSHRRQLEHIAFVDPVTGGMNNARFQYSCRRVLDGAKPGAFTVVSLNLMDYRLINEIFGPKEGISGRTRPPRAVRPDTFSCACTSTGRTPSLPGWGKYAPTSTLSTPSGRRPII